MVTLALPGSPAPVAKGRRWKIAAVAAGLAVSAAAAPAAGGEAEARALVAAATGRVLVITWSPLNVLRLELRGGGALDVIGTGLRHCNGPTGGGWRIDDGRLCLATPWSAPCFAVTTAEGGRFILRQDGDRDVASQIVAGPLGGC